jgi:predicted O-methyltransferase YrrM
MTLAAMGDGTAGEIGTGCGVGAAWIAAGLRPTARLVTIEVDTERADAARSALAADPRIEVLRGDWRELLPLGPFRLLFVDGGQAKASTVDLFAEALGAGGVIVLDDLTPVEQWPAEWRGHPDLVRERWLHDGRFVSTEVGVGYDKVEGKRPAAAIIAVRR